MSGEGIELYDEEESAALDSPVVSSNEVPRVAPSRVGFFITLPAYMGYACCFALQRELSYLFGLSKGVSGTRLSFVYGVGVSFVHLFNLVFRMIGHNVFCGCLSPRNRVVLALMSMIISMSMLSYCSLRKDTPNVAWVFVSYAFAGACGGSYGPNMLNVVKEMGDTRLYVVLGMPSGVALITIGGFCAIASGIPFQVCYIVTVFATIIGLILYLATIYRQGGNCTSDSSLVLFCRDLRQICAWFPKIWLHCLVFICDMACIALFNPGCTLYVYGDRIRCHLLGVTIGHGWFFLIYNFAGFVGDYLSRKVMNEKALICPLWFLMLLVFGVALNLALIPEIAPLAAFLIMWANGGLYVQSTKLFQREFVHAFHLTATSLWLFLGDCGSTIGSNMVQIMRKELSSLKSQMY